jgi:XTP/dITP diphosphohydrolase
MSGVEDRKAYFESCLAYKEPGKDVILAFGRCDGEISLKPMEGSHGFGFDPVFIPYVDIGKLSDKSFSQMEIEEKNKYSHRSKAITDLINKLAKVN